MRLTTPISDKRVGKGQWIALALCMALISAWAFEQFVFQRPAHAPSSPLWLPPLAAGLSAAGLIQMAISYKWKHVWKGLYLTGLLLMVWAANGLLFDFLTMAGLIGDPATGLPATVNWPGMATRTLAFASAIVLVRQFLKPADNGFTDSARWYGYAAFVFALPYPLFRIWWALGGTPGLNNSGAAGEGFAPLVLAIPWIMAACLSLLLVSPPHWMPRRLLLFAGWTATAIVASIAPAACWSVIKGLTGGGNIVNEDISAWVFILFYVSWLLWAITAFAATRSYQMRTAHPG